MRKIGLLLVGLLAACGGSNGDGDGGASVTTQPAAVSAEFCSILRDGAAELDDQTAAAGESAGEQLALLAENIGDFSRLLRRLEASAPDEIESDMAAVADSWAAQADDASEMASNPLGGVAGVVMRSLLTSSSVEAVDEYAERECGRGLFGTGVERLAEEAEAAAAGGPPKPSELFFVKCGAEGWSASALDVGSGEARVLFESARAAGTSICSIAGTVLGSEVMLSRDGRFLYMVRGVLVDLQTGTAVNVEQKMGSLSAGLRTGSGLNEQNVSLDDHALNPLTNEIYFQAGGSYYTASAAAIVAGSTALDGPNPIERLGACFVDKGHMGVLELATPRSVSGKYCRFGDRYFLLNDPVGSSSRFAIASGCPSYFGNDPEWLDDETLIGPSSGVVSKPVTTEDCPRIVYRTTGDRGIEATMPLPGSRRVFLISDHPRDDTAEIYGLNVDSPGEPVLVAAVPGRDAVFIARGSR